MNETIHELNLVVVQILIYRTREKSIGRQENRELKSNIFVVV